MGRWVEKEAPFLGVLGRLCGQDLRALFPLASWPISPFDRPQFPLWESVRVPALQTTLAAEGVVGAAGTQETGAGRARGGARSPGRPRPEEGGSPVAAGSARRLTDAGLQPGSRSAAGAGPGERSQGVRLGTRGGGRTRQQGGPAPELPGGHSQLGGPLLPPHRGGRARAGRDPRPSSTDSSHPTPLWVPSDLDPGPAIH